MLDALPISCKIREHMARQVHSYTVALMEISGARFGNLDNPLSTLPVRTSWIYLRYARLRIQTKGDAYFQGWLSYTNVIEKSVQRDKWNSRNWLSSRENSTTIRLCRRCQKPYRIYKASRYETQTYTRFQMRLIRVVLSFSQNITGETPSSGEDNISKTNGRIFHWQGARTSTPENASTTDS